MINLIGETGFTHKGELEYIFRQIGLISEAGFDYVKLQMLFDVDAGYTPMAPAYDDLRRHRLSESDWGKTLKLAHDEGLKVVAMPIDYQAARFVEAESDLIDTIEVHSIALNDLLLLEEIAALLLRCDDSFSIMLGVGGRSLAEVRYAQRMISSKLQTLMYGFQNFPTAKNKSNLGKIRTLKQACKIPVGYADHTPWNEDDSDMMQIALGLGATQIEKHIILEEGDQTRPDYFSAVSKEGALRLKENVFRFLEIYGKEDPQFLSLSEEKYRRRERKIVASELIQAGQVLTREVLTYKVTDSSSGLPQNIFCDILGKKVRREIAKHRPLEFEDFE